MKQSEKSAANLVLGLYFFPFVVTLVVSFSTSFRHIGFAMAIATTAVCAIALFLALKRVTEEQRVFKKKYNIEEMTLRLSALEQETVSMKADKQGMEQALTQEKERGKQLSTDLERMAHLEHDLVQAKHAVAQLKEELLQKSIDSTTVHHAYQELQKEVARILKENEQLAYELKTLVRAKSKTNRVLLRSSQEEIPESASAIYN